jgi:hypothetical protein
VVAAEVRKLAERSQVAAQEIGELASGSVKMAERAGSCSTRSCPSIQQDLRPGAGDHGGLRRAVAKASGRSTRAMSQLNQITQQNASASEELAATAEEMSGQAEQLQQTMAFFKLSDIDSARGPAIASRAQPRMQALKPACARRPIGLGARFRALLRRPPCHSNIVPVRPANALAQALGEQQYLTFLARRRDVRHRDPQHPRDHRIRRS